MGAFEKFLTIPVSFIVLGCGPGQTTQDRTSPRTPSPDALERALELGRNGSGADWQSATTEEKYAFALAAVVGVGLETARREDVALELQDCIDRDATTSPEQTVAHLGATCLNEIRSLTGVNKVAVESCGSSVTRLIQGNVGDWRAATPECQTAYAVVSIDAATGRPPLGTSEVDAFKNCMNSSTKSSLTHKSLATPSRDCVLPR